MKPAARGRMLPIPIGARVRDLAPEHQQILFDRGRAHDAGVAAAVAELIADVRARGDDALRAQAQRFGAVSDLRIEVPRAECTAALAGIAAPLRDALELAAHNIAAFHRAQLPVVHELEVQPGVRLGRRADPLERVAVYAPGGRAAYPSSVLMGVVPARVAGTGEVVVCSPAGPGGRPADAVLAACSIAGADRLFAIGGAGAVAAVAYGTATIARVDKIVGPGNAYVTEAKRQLNGEVAIDCPAGPSEVLVLADDSADALRVASELLAQAEHDPDATSVLVTTSLRIIEAVRSILTAAIDAQPRSDIIRRALATRGALLLAQDESEMAGFCRQFAPEHVVLYVGEPRALLAQTMNAGTVFLGHAASVAYGDYLTGANHVLPTAGRARAYSGLSVLDFLRWTTYQEITAEGAAALAGPTARLAEAEGLLAHAFAAGLGNP